jgi:subtilisin family serine protease
MPDSNVNEKIDTALRSALSAWEQMQDPEAGISVSLRFEGDLASIEALGFETAMVSFDTALGVVRFKDIPALTAHPGVLWIAAGRRRSVKLDSAARDIRARAAAPISGAPVNGLWHATGPTNLTNVANATGEDVIIAIIDTGIDYKHPMFLSQLSPKTTRILKIWDQGLTPSAVADCPNVARLASANTYGVEYDKNEIEADLRGGTPILHKDCNGHGTHCAGIAAGGTIFPSGGDANIVGVAPKASLIVVKLVDTPEHIFYRLPSNAAGPEVGWDLRFSDAVLYCLRTARDEFHKPIVISMSIGRADTPGDGLDDNARLLDRLLDPAAAAGPNNFPTGAIIVKAAGNEGDIADSRTARITVPPAGQITIPFRLTDTRQGLQTRWTECAQRQFKPAVGIHFWYRAPAALLSVQFRIHVPPNGAFGSSVSGGANTEIGYNVLPGPPPSVVAVAPSSAVHRAGISSETPAAVPHPDGGTVHRHYMNVFVRPKEALGIIYNQGIYEVEITAPPGTVFFAMCDRESWARSMRVSFSVATTMRDGSPAPGQPHLVVNEDFSLVDSFGRNVITVAAYDDKNGATGPTQGEIAAFSSRGPLRNFSNPPNPARVLAPKPDIAAPGVQIMSAEGIDTEVLTIRGPAFFSGRRFAQQDGTSMATPMVAGVIALMLDKKSDLNITQARAALFAGPRAPVNPSTAPASTNAYGRGRVDAMSSHSSTP